MADAPSLTIEFKNERPVELTDLTASFSALGQSYEDFVYSRGYDPLSKNVRLYIRELRTGSIFAELISLAEQASFIFEHAEIYAGFITNLDELTKYFLSLRLGADEPSRREAAQYSQIIEPVAKDGGSQLFLNVKGDVKFENHFHITSEEANAAQNGVRRYLGDRPPVSGFFQSEPLYLSQLRGDTRSKWGDRGVIEKFSRKPVRLIFANEEVKRQILDLHENPFSLVYLVDGEVSTVEDEPVIYKIFYVRDSFPRT